MYLYVLFLLLFFFTAIYQNNKIVCHLNKILVKTYALFFSFIYPKIEWEEKLNKNEHYIFCPNHVSTLDIPFILAIIPNPLQFMGKAEIAKLPLFGYFYKNNSVIVDRENRKDAYSAFLKAAEKLNEGH